MLRQQLTPPDNQPHRKEPSPIGFPMVPGTERRTAPAQLTAEYTAASEARGITKAGLESIGR
jgi:hypothetical protein